MGRARSSRRPKLRHRHAFGTPPAEQPPSPGSSIVENAEQVKSRQPSVALTPGKWLKAARNSRQQKMSGTGIEGKISGGGTHAAPPPPRGAPNAHPGSPVACPGVPTASTRPHGPPDLAPGRLSCMRHARNMAGKTLVYQYVKPRQSDMLSACQASLYPHQPNGHSCTYYRFVCCYSWQREPLSEPIHHHMESLLTMWNPTALP